MATLAPRGVSAACGILPGGWCRRPRNNSTGCRPRKTQIKNEVCHSTSVFLYSPVASFTRRCIRRSAFSAPREAAYHASIAERRAAKEARPHSGAGYGRSMPAGRGSAPADRARASSSWIDSSVSFERSRPVKDRVPPSPRVFFHLSSSAAPPLVNRP